MMIIGSSNVTASPIVSVFRSSPGPDVHVTPSAPPNAAPSAIDAAAISSSAWIVRTPMSCRRDSACSRSDAGVIGYAPNTSGSPLLIDAAIEPERGRVGAVDVAVRARRDLGVRVDRDLHVDQLRRLAEAPAGPERGQVGGHDVTGELGADPLLRDLGRAVVEPAQHAEREQVLGLLGVAARHALEVLDGARRERAHRDPLDGEAVERAVLERVDLVARLLHRAHGERVLVDEDRGAAAASARGSPSAPRGSSPPARPARRPASGCRATRSGSGTPRRRRRCRRARGSRPGSRAASRGRCRRQPWHR